MPLYKSVTIGNDTQLLVWKITESLDELCSGTGLKDFCRARLDNMKSAQHQKGFMSVRKLLKEIGYTDFDLYYGEDGKPHLRDGKNISITHSHGFSALIISSRNVGIDMELQREKVINIADKFITAEFEYLNPENAQDYTKRLIVIWGVKEALFKMISRHGISFKQNMYVHPFETGNGQGEAKVTFEEINTLYTFYFEEIENYMLVYSFEKNNPENTKA